MNFQNLNVHVYIDISIYLFLEDIYEKSLKIATHKTTFYDISSSIIQILDLLQKNLKNIYIYKKKVWTRKKHKIHDFFLLHYILFIKNKK